MLVMSESKHSVIEACRVGIEETPGDRNKCWLITAYDVTGHRIVAARCSTQKRAETALKDFAINPRPADHLSTFTDV